VEAAAGVLDGLAVGLEGESDVGAADLVSALVAVGHAAVVVGHTHFENGDAHTLNPAAETVLAVPFGVPVGRRRTAGPCFFPGKSWAWTLLFSGQGDLMELVKVEDAFGVKAVIGGRLAAYHSLLDSIAS